MKPRRVSVYCKVDGCGKRVADTNAAKAQHLYEEHPKLALKMLLNSPDKLREIGRGLAKEFLGMLRP